MIVVVITELGERVLWRPHLGGHSQQTRIHATPSCIVRQNRHWSTLYCTAVSVRYSAINQP